MNVIHIINAGDMGGANRHLLSLCKELQKQVKVKIVNLAHSAFAEEARDLGLDLEVVDSGSFVRDLFHVAGLVRQGAYDIVHSHGAKPNILSVAMRPFVRASFVTTVHSDYRLDYLHSFPKRVTLGLLNQLALRRIDYYVSVSSSITQLLAGKGFDRKRIMSLNNSIDFDAQVPEPSRKAFAAKYGLRLAPDETIVGILARLTPVKDIPTFLKAAARIVREEKSVRFLIAGDGEERVALETLTRTLGLEGHVFFLGFVQDTDQFLANIDICVLTSISEGFPFSVVEAARLKKVVVSTAVGGIPDLVVDGDTGCLFTPGDHEALARHILLLTRDGETRRALGERLYAKAKTEFSLKTMCDNQLSIYRQILEQQLQASGTPESGLVSGK